jgi:hypothetical protein
MDRVVPKLLPEDGECRAHAAFLHKAERRIQEQECGDCRRLDLSAA